MIDERWLPVPDFEGLYEVSDLGHVKSAPRKGTRGGDIQPWLDTAGYPRVSLQDGRRKIQGAVHRMVASAFLGPADGRHVRHLDGVPTHCELSNLAYGTRGENTADSVAHGTHNMASKSSCPQGHPYDEANTLHCAGRRVCRTCARDRARKRVAA